MAERAALPSCCELQAFIKASELGVVLPVFRMRPGQIAIFPSRLAGIDPTVLVRALDQVPWQLLTIVRTLLMRRAHHP